jgi:hypothetical protein
MMKFVSPLSFDIRHSLFIIRYSFLVPACPGCHVFYLPIKYSSFHPEAAQITYKELEVKRKKMAAQNSPVLFFYLCGHPFPGEW